MSSNADVINDAYEAFSRGDIQAVIGAVDENASWDVSAAVPQGGSFRGKDGVGQFFQGLGGTWESLDLQIDDVVDGGESIVGVGRASGTLKDGRSASYGFAHVFTMDDGRIVRFREYVDPDETLRG